MVSYCPVNQLSYPYFLLIVVVSPQFRIHIMSCKQNHPFRLGTSSYIIPADILANIEYLKDKVDDVELVLFESDEISNLPTADDIFRLKEISSQENLTYSIHLPLDAYLGSDNGTVRERSVEKCRKIIELTQALEPSAFVMHAEAGPDVNVNMFSRSEKERFAQCFHESLDALFSSFALHPSLFCVETLNYPLTILDDVIASIGLSVTLDIGHLELYGYSVEDHLRGYLDRTRVFHLHGTCDGKDHRGLEHTRPVILDMIMKALSDNQDTSRVVTMEVFSEEDFQSSCREMMRFVG